MVLQRDAPVPVRGTAAPGATIQVTLGKTATRAKAGPDGAWTATLAPQTATADTASPLALTVTADGTPTAAIRLDDILVGDIWLCAGQSNIEFPIVKTATADAELADAANHPRIRLLDIANRAATTPQSDPVTNGPWKKSSPDAIRHFSAIGFFFARELSAKTGVPVGLIDVSWGGTTIEPWMSSAALATVAGPGDPKSKTDPRAIPSGIYNAKIAPVLRLPMRGVLWYHGESNVSRAAQYGKLLPALVNDWRRAAPAPLPFLIVQLPNYNKPPVNAPAFSKWAEIRESQTLALALPDTSLTVTTDLGQPDEIHPPEKRELARRLVLAALHDVYGYKNIDATGPVFSRHTLLPDGKIRVGFLSKTALKTTDGGALVTGFTVAGEDKHFLWAEAELGPDGAVTVTPPPPLLHHGRVASLRYNWADNPNGNLVNASGLPARAFRTDDWPPVTLGQNTP
jgi:sialate O-acetylesterase